MDNETNRLFDLHLSVWSRRGDTSSRGGQALFRPRGGRRSGCSKQKDQQGGYPEHLKAGWVRGLRQPGAAEEQPDTLSEGEGQTLEPAPSVQSGSCVLLGAELHRG